MSRTASQPKADISRGRILDAAAALFRERGYSAVSLRDIAAGADMKAGSVYYHFASKEEIVLEVLRLGIAAVHDQVHKTLASLPAGTPADRVLRAGMLAHLRTLYEFNDYSSANVRIYHHVPEAVRRANAAERRRYERLWDELLHRPDIRRALRPEPELKLFRQLLIGSLNATLDWFDGRKGQIAALADQYADILLRGALRP